MLGVKREEEEDVQMVNFTKELQKYLSEYGQPLCVERMCRTRNLIETEKVYNMMIYRHINFLFVSLGNTMKNDYSKNIKM